MILKSMGVECKKDDMDGYAVVNCPTRWSLNIDIWISLLIIYISSPGYQRYIVLCYARYAGEVDEEATGKFSFLQFCQVDVDDHHDGDDDN